MNVFEYEMQQRSAGVGELKYEWARIGINWLDPLCDLDPCRATRSVSVSA